MREIADNKTDFIIADEMKDDFILLLGAEENMDVASTPFDIDGLCQKNAAFRTRLNKTLSEINALEKGDDFIAGSFNKIQNFISKQMPMPLDDNRALNDRFGALMDGEPFSYFVEHKECMCSERAAMAQYILQQIGIKSYLAASFAKIEGINDRPEPHSYIIFENKGKMFVYDPANPRSKNKSDNNREDEPRILDTNMNKTIFEDFVAAINHNPNGRKVDKKRVGFHCVDPIDGRNFVYCSTCGVKGQNITPKKLEEIRYGSNPPPAKTNE